MGEAGRRVETGRKSRQVLARRDIPRVVAERPVGTRKRAPSITNIPRAVLRVPQKQVDQPAGLMRAVMPVDEEEGEYRRWELGPHCFIVPMADLGLQGVAWAPEYEQAMGQLERVREFELRSLYGRTLGTMPRLVGDQMRRICFKVNAVGDVYVRAVTMLDIFESRQARPVDYGEEAPTVAAAAIGLAWKVESILDSLYSVCCAAGEVFEARALVTPQRVHARMLDLFAALGYDVTFPVASTFLRRFIAVGKLSKHEVLVARYALDLAMTDNSLARLAGSCVAAAATAVALGSRWSILLEVYTGYSWAFLQPLEARLRKLMETASRARCFITRLYSHPLFGGIATFVREQRPGTR